jgi:hypothetical protein
VERYVVPSKGQQIKGNNMFTPGEKLHMALEMAESLALLHGYEGGAISHNDVQLSQWLRSKRDRLVLGDFHSSRMLSWNHQRQAYCPYSTGTVFGNVRAMWNGANQSTLVNRLTHSSLCKMNHQYRSPEEYASSLLNEQVRWRIVTCCKCSTCPHLSF